MKPNLLRMAKIKTKIFYMTVWAKDVHQILYHQTTMYRTKIKEVKTVSVYKWIWMRGRRLLVLTANLPKIFVVTCMKFV